MTHYWKDPAAARVFMNNWMRPKLGSGAQLKKRSIPTISEGIKAGLVPLTDNPIEIAMRYVTNMDHYIAMNEVIEAGRSAGTVKFFTPGSPRVPEGWVTLNGHIAERRPPKGPTYRLMRRRIGRECGIISSRQASIATPIWAMPTTPSATPRTWPRRACLRCRAITPWRWRRRLFSRGWQRD